MLLPSLAAAAVLVAMTAQGGIAASFAVSGQSFKLSADRLEGTGFSQYVGVATTADGDHAAAVAVIDEARLSDLCQSVLVDTPVGEVTLLVRAGRDGQPVTARNLVIDMRQLSGDAHFTDMEIGRDAGTLSLGADATAPIGGFSQSGGTVRITGLRQHAYAVNAGTLKLNGLRLGIEPGDRECF
ncbi:DUF6230 family protein [Streptomonospora litoralis]|uniref:DUF6230 family protein n=1 Tax=Streptomonospora litoralis TaxID=2498135 RepID=UPI001F613F30|nr:DUF6230 family protein [Streptomonospora litoralis]